MKRKKIIALVAALAVSALGFGALSYFSGTAEKKENQFNIVAGQKDQNDAGTIQEPAQENGGKADAAAGLQPDQIVPKDPYIVSNVDWTAQAIMKVEVPKFTEDPNTGKPAAELLNVNADGKWKLLRELDDTEKHTVVYGYTEPLAGNNSTKPEAERAKTSSLFDSFKITGDISLANTYTGVIRVSGILLQTEGHTTVDGAAEGDGVIPKSYAITYDLGENAVLSGQKTKYTADDYGYTPPTPTREGYEFTGWTPASIEDGKTGDISFTAQWIEKTATIDNNKLETKIQANRNTLTSFVRTTAKPSTDAMVADNIVSTSDSDTPVYAWVNENKTVINWYSEAVHPKLGENCNGLFANCQLLTDLSGIPSWNTANVTDMSVMFSGCCSLTALPDLSFQDTKNVTNMYGMFMGCQDLADISSIASLDTGNVTNMGSMFDSCEALSDISALSSLNTANVTDMNAMFANCENLTDLSNLSSQDTGNVTNMYMMFSVCKKLSSTYGINEQNIQKVTNFSSMFESCRNLTEVSSLASWNTGSVTNMSDMFYGCVNLANISGLSSWYTGNVTNMSEMFCDCVKLTDVSAINDWDISKVTNFDYMFESCPSHPEFTKRTGTQTSDGTFIPST